MDNSLCRILTGPDSYDWYIRQNGAEYLIATFNDNYVVFQPLLYTLKPLESQAHVAKLIFNHLLPGAPVLVTRNDDRLLGINGKTILTNIPMAVRYVPSKVFS